MLLIWVPERPLKLLRKEFGGDSFQKLSGDLCVLAQSVKGSRTLIGSNKGYCSHLPYLKESFSSGICNSLLIFL